jgi:hypothetical protein
MKDEKYLYIDFKPARTNEAEKSIEWTCCQNMQIVGRIEWVEWKDSYIFQPVPSKELLIPGSVKEIQHFISGQNQSRRMMNAAAKAKGEANAK